MMKTKIYDNIVKKDPILKGFSGDKKYCATTMDGCKYLLRVVPMEKLEAWQKLYEMLERIAELGVPMSKVIELGTCLDGVYILHIWIDGEDLETALPNLSEAEQYKLGVKAGEILRVIHSIPAPENEENWCVKFYKLIDDRMEKYYKCELNRTKGNEHFISYIEQNREPLKSLLENRPQCLLHDDYSTHNMMYENSELRIVDFAQCRFGDTWYDFFKNIFTARISPYFASGQIHGYFNGEPPDDFFKLVAFYASAQLLTAITFTITTYGQEKVDSTIEMISDILKSFDNMSNPVPTWYLKDFHVQDIDGISCRLKEPFDFSFLNEYGKVFKIFDEQASGCICFGVSNGKNKYFIKYAGVRTINNYDLPVSDAIARSKAAVVKYEDLAHPLLIDFIEAKEVNGGFMTVFDWFDGDNFSIETPLLRQQYWDLPIDKKIYIFEEILRFHEHVAKCGYVAMDFNDYSVLYNFDSGEVKICDIDFYAKQSYINGMGRALGDQVIMSPEEFRIGGLVDEISNVYNMGATAFRLFCKDECERSPEAWTLSPELYAVAKKAVSDERSQRQQSIQKLIEEWRAAKR